MQMEWRRREFYEDEEYEEMVEDFKLVLALRLSYQEVLDLTEKERAAAIQAYNEWNKTNS